MWRTIPIGQGAHILSMLRNPEVVKPANPANAHIDLEAGDEGVSAMTYQEAAAWLRQHDRYLILTHKRPDGDTIGCAAALCAGLRRLGKTAHICSGTGETHLFTPYLEGYLAPEGYEPETVVSTDIAARSLFTGKGAVAGAGDRPAIDHHPSQEFFARRPAWTPGGPPAAS